MEKRKADVGQEVMFTCWGACDAIVPGVVETVEEPREGMDEVRVYRVRVKGWRHQVSLRDRDIVFVRGESGAGEDPLLVTGQVRGPASRESLLAVREDVDVGAGRVHGGCEGSEAGAKGQKLSWAQKERSDQETAGEEDATLEGTEAPKPTATTPALLTHALNQRDEARRKAQKYERALRAIQKWDCLNPPRGELLSDLPWLKQLVDTALSESE